MAFQIFPKWISRWRRRREDIKNPETKYETDNTVSKDKFSPMTYQNPCIMYMQDIIKQVIRRKNIPARKLELIIVDAEEDRDDDDNDIENVLYELLQQLNYLLLVTDRPGKYEDFMEMAYEENGLIVQKLPKTARKQARGNLVLDFERTGGIRADNMQSSMIYVPVYKRPWEIGENLDIIVPVGYNTLVVSGIFPCYLEGECQTDEKFEKDRKLDRLDREFRKG